MSKDIRNFKQWHSISCTLIMITRNYENTSHVHATWPVHLIFLDLIVCAFRPTQYMPLCEHCLLNIPCFAKCAIQCKAAQATTINLFPNNLGDTKQISQSSAMSIIHQIHQTRHFTGMLTHQLSKFHKAHTNITNNTEKYSSIRKYKSPVLERSIHQSKIFNRNTSADAPCRTTKFW